MSDYLLALDAGTGSGRAAVFDEDGGLLACVQEEWSYQERTHPGDFMPGYEFDAERFWGVFCRTIRAALERAKVAPGDVAGVAATSQREGSVFLDADGRELLATPNFDSRGIHEGVEIIERFGADRLYRVTGHTPPFIFPLARLLWWRKRFADRPVAHFLMISDWATYRLTGERVAEPSNAGESLLFDIERRAWSDDILDAFAIDRSALPGLRAAGAPAGTVTKQAAAETGLLEGTPVFTGGADTQCALLGNGVLEPGEAGAVLGTTTPVQLVLDRPAFDAERQLWAGAHVVPDRWVLESNAGDTGKAYHWLLELLGVRPLDGAGYAAIEREALRANPDVPVYSFIGPSIFDLRNMNPARAAGLLFPYPFGRQRPGRPEVFFGFLESVAFAVRANVEQIEDATGSRIARLSIGGGMTQGRLLVRLVSQVTRLPLLVSNVAETAALGAAILAGTGAGLYPSLDAAVRRAVHLEEVLPEEPGSEPQRYRKWRELYGILDGTIVP
ncbi:MAG: FGGY-family carbohydrate kinase [Candidatus Binatia bacterium]